MLATRSSRIKLFDQLSASSPCADAESPKNLEWRSDRGDYGDSGLSPGHSGCAGFFGGGMFTLTSGVPDTSFLTCDTDVNVGVTCTGSPLSPYADLIYLRMTVIFNLSAL